MIRADFIRLMVLAPLGATLARFVSEEVTLRPSRTFPTSPRVGDLVSLDRRLHWFDGTQWVADEPPGSRLRP